MPIIKSAKKRVRTANKAAVRNAKAKRSLKSAVKAFQAAIDGGSKAKIAKTLSEAQSAVDVAAKKNIIHKNKAARKKAQLAKQAKSADKSPKRQASAEKTPPKKAVTKKPAAKKSATKKSK